MLYFGWNYIMWNVTELCEMECDIYNKMGLKVWYGTLHQEMFQDGKVQSGMVATGCNVIRRLVIKSDYEGQNVAE
jgi:hypothetical protein